MPRIDLLLTILIVAALIAACDSSEDEPAAPPSIGTGPGISIADALASTLDQPLLVNGFLVATADRVRFCDGLAESYPPQCAGPSLTIEGLDFDTVDDLKEASGVRWTDFPFQLLGTVQDGVITVDSLASG